MPDATTRDAAAAAAAPAEPDAVRLSADDGAQAVEYAMVGGLGAGLIGLLWAIISKTGLIDRVVQALLAALVDLIGSWF